MVARGFADKATQDVSINGPVLRGFQGRVATRPRPRSKFADFTPPAAEPLARCLKNCPIDGQFFRHRLFGQPPVPGVGGATLQPLSGRAGDGRKTGVLSPMLLLVDGGDGRHGAGSVAHHALLALGHGRGACPVEGAAHQPHVREVGRGVVAGGASRDDG